MKHFSNMPFKYKVLIGCIVVALVPLILYNLLVFTIFNARLTAQNNEAAGFQLGEMHRRLENILETSEQALGDLSNNYILYSALLDRGQKSTTEVNLELFRAGNKLQTGVDISLYDAGGKLHYTTNNSRAPKNLPLRWGILNKALREDSAVFYNVSDSGDDSEYLLYAARPLSEKSGFLVGYVVIGYTREAFLSLFSGSYEEQGTVFLLDSHGEAIFSTRQQAGTAELQNLRAWLLATGNATHEFKDSVYHFETNSQTGASLVLRQPTPVVGSAMATLRNISIIMALISFALCIIFSLLISRSLSRPVSELNNAMVKMQAGDLGTRLEINSTDEFGRLGQSFNQMAQDLNQYMQTIVENQHEMDEARIRLLQAQLNPHFLYNTLDTVKWLAKINNIPEIASISNNLAIILRQCVSANYFVTLSKELDMVESYIDIQRIRFSGRFEYTVDVPPELEDCEIPKLILQPIVENAILHGLEDKQDGHIYIYAAAGEDTLLIQVTDNGRGMPAEEAKSLNAPKDGYHEGHLGLHNVQSIIQKNYGTQFGLYARAIEDIGTTITVKLPLKRGEGNV